MLGLRPTKKSFRRFSQVCPVRCVESACTHFRATIAYEASLADNPPPNRDGKVGNKCSKIGYRLYAEFGKLSLPKIK